MWGNTLNNKNINELSISKEELLNKKFYTNKDFLLREIADEHILIPLISNNMFDNTIKPLMKQQPIFGIYFLMVATLKMLLKSH